MSACCIEHNCRRVMPILVRRAAFSGQWVALTRYKRHGEDDKRPGLIEALEKHTLPAETQVEIELGSSVLRGVFEFVKGAYADAADGSEAEVAYRAVLDEIERLADAKETELRGPVGETA